MLKFPLPAINDRDGLKVPESLPMIVDSHVHLFPPKIFKSIWKWFEEYGWPIRYQLDTSGILEFLLSRGVNHIIVLQYAHKPGIAQGLNNYLSKQCRKYPEQVTGLATVFPGEEGSELIIKNAFQSGLKGIKLHAHVQCFDMNSKEMDIIYETCSSLKKPIVMHVGREPKSPAYKCDPYLLCSADKLERIIKNFPKLRVCVPHLGINEFSEYQHLIEKYDNLWLDTAMALTDYLPGHTPPSLNKMRLDRIMYGSDFPNIPYAWDRELQCIHKANLSKKSLKLILGKNAINFFSIEKDRATN